MALPPMIHGPVMVVAILAAYALAMAFRSSHVSLVNVFGFAIAQSSRSRDLMSWNLTLIPLPSWMRIRGSELAPCPEPDWIRVSDSSVLKRFIRVLCIASRLGSERGFGTDVFGSGGSDGVELEVGS